MVDDKYVGLALAVASSIAIGTSTVITKMVGCAAAVPGTKANELIQGLTAAADGTAATENMSYLRNPVWWGGMSACASQSSSCDHNLTFSYAVVVGEGRR